MQVLFQNQLVEYLSRICFVFACQLFVRFNSKIFVLLGFALNTRIFVLQCTMVLEKRQKVEPLQQHTFEPWQLKLRTLLQTKARGVVQVFGVQVSRRDASGGIPTAGGCQLSA